LSGNRLLAYHLRDGATRWWQMKRGGWSVIVAYSLVCAATQVL